MAKGGARTRSGPAPEVDALRRDRDAKDWVDLPAEGRRGRVPAWPLTAATQRERTIWNRLWKLPQATVWEQHRQFDQVALYTRRFVEAETRGSPVNLSTLVRQMADSLGLTEVGMRANRWRIVKDQVAEKRQARTPPARPPARDRFKVVAGGGG